MQNCKKCIRVCALLLGATCIAHNTKHTTSEKASQRGCGSDHVTAQTEHTSATSHAASHHLTDSDQSTQETEGVYTYIPERDRGPVVQIINENAHAIDSQLSMTTLDEHKHTYVYYDGSTLAGCIIYDIERVPLQETYVGNIELIIVNPRYKGKRIAQKLLSHAKKDIEQRAHAMLLDTAADNYPARRAYERFGFRLLDIKNRVCTYVYDL